MNAHAKIEAVPVVAVLGIVVGAMMIVAGVTVRMFRAPALDAPWVIFAVGSMTLFNSASCSAPASRTSNGAATTSRSGTWRRSPPLS